MSFWQGTAYLEFVVCLWENIAIGTYQVAFMVWEIGKAIDHYILFRDTDDPAPVDYNKRCSQQDLLIGDKASYVWGYVGELTGLQAGDVRVKLDLMFEGKFNEEAFSPPLLRWSKSGTIEVIPRLPGALAFLKHVSSNLDFLEHAPVNKSVKIKPKSDEESQRILEELFCRSTWADSGFEFTYKSNRLEIQKICRSFVELLSLETLMDGWQGVGCRPDMEPLRRTAEIWVSEVLEGSKIYTSGEKLSPEGTENIFKSSLIDPDLTLLTLRQSQVLGRCVDVANSIRKTYGCENKNIENKYVMKTDTAAPVLVPAPAMEKKPTATTMEDAGSPPPPAVTKKPKQKLCGDSPQEKQSRSKYEDPVQAIISLNIPKVVAGQADPLKRKEIASQLKNEWKEFSKPQVGSIEKRVGETMAWEKYEEYLNKAWKEAELGETYTKRKVGGQRRNRKNLDLYIDVQ